MWSVVSSALSALAALFGFGSKVIDATETADQQKAGAVAQQEADQAGVLSDVQTSNKAADAITAGGRRAAVSVLLRDSRPN